MLIRKSIKMHATYHYMTSLGNFLRIVNFTVWYSVRQTVVVCIIWNQTMQTTVISHETTWISYIFNKSNWINCTHSQLSIVKSNCRSQIQANNAHSLHIRTATTQRSPTSHNQGQNLVFNNPWSCKFISKLAIPVKKCTQPGQNVHVQAEAFRPSTPICINSLNRMMKRCKHTFADSLCTFITNKKCF